MDYEALYNELIQYVGEETVRHMHEMTLARTNYANLKRSRDAIINQAADLQEKYNAATREIRRLTGEDDTDTSVRVANR